MTADDRRRTTAAHEAAHFLAGYQLANEIAPALTLRKTPGYAGACLRQPGTIVFTGHDRDGLLVDADPALRRRCEIEIIRGLVGDEAGRLVAPTIGYLPEPEPDLLAGSLRELPPRTAAALTDAEAAPPEEYTAGLDGDELQAMEVAWRLVGLGAADLVAYLRTEAKRWVARNAGAIVAIATELSRHTVLTGQRAAAIVEEAPSAPSTT